MKLTTLRNNFIVEHEYWLEKNNNLIAEKSVFSGKGLEEVYENLAISTTTELNI